MQTLSNKLPEVVKITLCIFLVIILLFISAACKRDIPLQDLPHDSTIEERVRVNIYTDPDAGRSSPIGNTFANIELINSSGEDIKVDNNYVLYGDDGKPCRTISDRAASEPFVMKHEERLKLKVDWTDVYGVLPAGSYWLAFSYTKSNGTFTSLVSFGLGKPRE